jgi:hypothetical protein
MFPVEGQQNSIVKCGYTEFNDVNPVFLTYCNGCIIQGNGFGGNPETFNLIAIAIEKRKQAAKGLSFNTEYIPSIKGNFEGASTLSKGMFDSGLQVFFPDVCYDILITVRTSVSTSEIGQKDWNDHDAPVNSNRLAVICEDKALLQTYQSLR